MFQRQFPVRFEEENIRKRNLHISLRFFHFSPAIDLVNLSIHHHQFPVQGIKGADAKISVAHDVLHRDKSFIMAQYQGLQQGCLI